MSWFASLAEQAFKLADELADTIVSQANEAQVQLQEEQKKLETEETQKKDRMTGTHVLLPWETTTEARQILCQELMEKVLGLPLQEGNFTITPANAQDVFFSFQEFVPVAMKLLQIDTNLARVHAKLSPKMDEETFWFNYYCRIVYLRALSGIDGVETQNAAEKWRGCGIVIAAPIQQSNSTQASSPSGSGSANFNSTPSTPIATKNLENSFDTVNINTPSKFSPIMSPLSDSSEQRGSAKNGVIMDDLDLELEENLKDLDLLEDLDDIDDYENIENNELDDELEAQIALELAEDD